MEFIDVPNIHDYNSKVSLDFFEALAKTDDMDIFTKKAVINAIQYMWPLTRYYTIMKLCFLHERRFRLLDEDQLSYNVYAVYNSSLLLVY